MRLHWLLLCTLVAVTCSATLSHAQVGSGDTAADKGEPGKSLAVIQLDAWMVTLSREAGDDVINSASAPLDDRGAVVDRILKMEKSGTILRSHHFMATTLEGQEVVVRMGRREPRVQAVTMTQFGVSQSLVYESVGTILNARSRLENDSLVALEMQLETSYLEESKAAIHVTKEGQAVNAPQVVQRTFHSTLACPSGGAVVAMSYEGRSDSEHATTIIYVAAEVLE